ncbi:formimidoylglutamate deiminase [Rhodovibrio salinarum]|uniref:Formimidoylglutamate deiminase n=1 Tax=Rhodovibrio salinarum TaxID=1087 RepID=A0A934QLY9_9PROT|nr:formimidoylglutamate deiminase [Rhodovibrio salinarum]MBK1698945.1 formimidoylglutamate deiminase [Rhodovibrio salinarum]
MTIIRADHALLPSGWARGVCVQIGADGRIAAVQTNRTAAATHTVDLLLPAPANVHSHAFQRAMAGLSEARGEGGKDSFWTWRRLMYRFLGQLDPDQVEAIAAFVQMEMLEAGYATNVEFHYLHHGPDGTPYDHLAEMAERIAAAAATSGIGLTLLPVHYQFGGCDRRPLADGQRRFGNDPDRFERLVAESHAALGALPTDARLGVAPHSLRAVDPEGLSRTVAVAEDGPVHMHLAEQQAEVDEVQAAHGQRPVAWLLDNAEVSARWCLIHCTQMTPEETRALAATGATAGLCPITESNLGDGTFDGTRWSEAGGAIAVGSDSNIRISLAEELRTLEYSQRLRDRNRAVLASPERSTGRYIFDAVCAGGAQAAGRESGAIQPGAWADLVALDTGHPDMAGVTGDGLLDMHIFAGDDRAVRDVWTGGRHVVRQGRHIHRDEIQRAYASAIVQLRDKL